MTITADLASGGTASTSISDYALGGTAESLTTMGANLSGFENVEALTFQLDIDTGIWDINFENITLANQQAPQEPGVTPAQQISELRATTVGADFMDLEWVNGDGSRRIVFMKEGTSGWPPVVDGTTYTANSDFSAAQDIGDGWRVVHRAMETTTATVTGLSQEAAYRVVALEYDGSGGGEAYLDTLEDNVINQPMSSVTAQWSGDVARDLDERNFWSFTDGALGPDGHSYILHYDYWGDHYTQKEGVISRWDANGWSDYASFRPADAGLDNLSDDLSIAIGDDGVIHIAFRGSIGDGVTSNRGVMYGRYDGGWHFEQVEFNSSSSGGKNTDEPVIALVDGEPHINYIMRDSTLATTEQYVRLASRGGGSWPQETWSTIEEPNSFNRVAPNYAMQADPDGVLHILYVLNDGDEGNQLRYRSNPMGSWQDVLVQHEGGRNFQALDLDLDEQGRVHGVFYVTGSEQTVYIEDLGGSRTVSTLTSSNFYLKRLFRIGNCRYRTLSVRQGGNCHHRC